MIRGALLTAGFSCLMFFAGAQIPQSGEWSFDHFMKLVTAHHPVARQAQLLTAKGDASVVEARGGFDLQMSAEVRQKQLNSTPYFRLFDGGFKLPTPLGINVNAGYELNNGAFLNAENTTPADGLAYVGMSVPLVRGLTTDNRRIALNKAQVYRQATREQQRSMLNDLYFEAGIAYWEWFRAYHVLRVYREALDVARQRQRAVLESAVTGDAPAVDTTEAGIQVQTRQLALTRARQDYLNQREQLAVQLWLDGTETMELPSRLIPESIEPTGPPIAGITLSSALDSLIRMHPDLRQYTYEIESLELDTRLRREMLKPSIELTYNALLQKPGNEVAAISAHNYTWGLRFAMPLQRRAERGSLEMAELEVREKQLARAREEAQLTMQARQALNNLSMTMEQLQLQRQTVENYETLLNAERQLFEAGESSLFLVNSREVNYINAQTGLITLISRKNRAELAVLYALGITNTIQ